MVFWNSKVAFQSNLNAFYNAVPNSTLFDMLHQYSLIGCGNGVAGFVDNRTSTKCRTPRSTPS
jgi:uncharacterized protein YjaG (DUF416 family)